MQYLTFPLIVLLIGLALPFIITLSFIALIIVLMYFFVIAVAVVIDEILLERELKKRKG